MTLILADWVSLSIEVAEALSSMFSKPSFGDLNSNVLKKEETLVATEKRTVNGILFKITKFIFLLS